jgi:hypothetical protein
VPEVFATGQSCAKTHPLVLHENQKSPRLSELRLGITVCHLLH